MGETGVTVSLAFAPDFRNVAIIFRDSVTGT